MFGTRDEMTGVGGWTDTKVCICGVEEYVLIICNLVVVLRMRN
jgi:hypothetical protein